MDSKKDQTPPKPTTATPAPKKRFTITRLEERVAPGHTKGGATDTYPVSKVNSHWGNFSY